MAQQTLGDVLGEIQEAAIPAASKRRLCAAAVGHAMRAPVAVGASSGGGNGISMLAEALECVRHFEGESKALDITDAKERLRQRGDAGRRLASLMGKVSQARTWSAHPEKLPAFLAGIRRLYAEGGYQRPPTSPRMLPTSPWRRRSAMRST